MSVSAVQTETRINLSGEIRTDSSGLRSLFDFYHTCNAYTNTTIYIDFTQLRWLDANLCSVLRAMLFKLSTDNGLGFYTDGNEIENRFDVLIRNGFIRIDNREVKDNRESCVKAESFARENMDGFLNYVEGQLMAHRGLSGMHPSRKDQILDDLMEIFANYNYHSGTHHPFFIAGQYYPRNAKLTVTMADLGVGFLPNIQRATAGTDSEVRTHIDAIKRAVTGFTSKVDTPGGLGLKNICKYCQDHRGELAIQTGDAYWSSRMPDRYTLIADNQFVGTVISLTFNTSNMNIAVK